MSDRYHYIHDRQQPAEGPDDRLPDCFIHIVFRALDLGDGEPVVTTKEIDRVYLEVLCDDGYRFECQVASRHWGDLLRNIEADLIAKLKAGQCELSLAERGFRR